MQRAAPPFDPCTLKSIPSNSMPSHSRNAPPEGVVAERCAVADDDEAAASPGQRHVQAPRVPQEAHGAPPVAPDGAEDDGLLLSACRRQGRSAEEGCAPRRTHHMLRHHTGEGLLTQPGSCTGNSAALPLGVSRCIRDESTTSESADKIYQSHYIWLTVSLCTTDAALPRKWQGAAVHNPAHARGHCRGSSVQHVHCRGAGLGGLHHPSVE